MGSAWKTYSTQALRLCHRFRQFLPRAAMRTLMTIVNRASSPDRGASVWQVLQPVPIERRDQIGLGDHADQTVLRVDHRQAVQTAVGEQEH